MKVCVVGICLLLIASPCYCWGFYMHRQINYFAVFLLPPEMLVLYKKNIVFLTEHSVDPDKRRYAVDIEAPRHYIDLDVYGDSLPPRNWKKAVEKFSEDSLNAHGVVPWWIEVMMVRLTRAFKEKDQSRILKYSAEIGHYIADSHVPLHTTSNYNGQLTNQQGIHGFWESRLPELIAAKHWDFFIGKAEYISHTSDYIWKRIMESAAAADSVLRIEKRLSDSFPEDRKFSFERRNGVVVRQYSSAYTYAYNHMLNNMVEHRFRLSVISVASLWFTAWVNAGQPDLRKLVNAGFSDDDQKEFEMLNTRWTTESVKGKSCD